MSRQLQGLLHQVSNTNSQAKNTEARDAKAESDAIAGARSEGEARAKVTTRRARHDAWPKQAMDVLDRDYGYVHLNIIIATLQPMFSRKVTPNMVFGKANRMDIAGRVPKHVMKKLPLAPRDEN